MNGLSGIFKVVAFACSLVVLLHVMPEQMSMAETGAPMRASLDNAESWKVQQQVVEAATRRYASLAP